VDLAWLDSSGPVAVVWLYACARAVRAAADDEVRGVRSTRRRRGRDGSCFARTQLMWRSDYVCVLSHVRV